MRGGYFIHPYGSYATFASFPTTGTKGVIFVDETALDLYIWDGISYVSLSSGGGGGPSTTDGLPEGTTNLYYTDGRADARIAAANINDLNDVNTGTPAVDNLLVWAGARWVARSLEDIAVKQYTLLLDEVSSTVSYVGEALPGSAQVDPVWRIKKLDESGTPELQVEWANGTSDFDKVWDDRATYTYS